MSLQQQRLDKAERAARPTQPQERAYVSVDPYDWAALEDEGTPTWKREEIERRYGLHELSGFIKFYIGISPGDWDEA